MSATARQLRLNPIGRFADVRHKERGETLLVNFIDCEPVTLRPKRARVQTPGHPLQGAVLMPGEYEILEMVT